SSDGARATKADLAEAAAPVAARLDAAVLGADQAVCDALSLALIVQWAGGFHLSGGIGTATQRSGA
ncbi:hypothetical protein ACU7M1_32165, partial [Burkholderia pseudomallei]|uniref:hypothetical protein n=1 Tax=Burkholderia pseudomallei TaxID=28450 RepID=UPI00406CC44C